MPETPDEVKNFIDDTQSVDEKNSRPSAALSQNPMSEETLRKPPFHNDTYHSYLQMNKKPGCQWCSWTNPEISVSKNNGHSADFDGGIRSTNSLLGANQIAQLLQESITFYLKQREKGLSEKQAWEDARDWWDLRGFTGKCLAYADRTVHHAEKRKTQEQTKK